MRLIDAPVGLFLFDGIMVMKTEYCTESDGMVTPDCYIVDSGEYFWGGVDTKEERNALEVTPVNALPLRCRIGDTVWVVGTKCLSGLFEYQCDINIDQGKCECNLNQEYIVFSRKVTAHIFCAIHDLIDPGFFKWGKTVFLTREEAEAALAKEGEK